MGIVASVDILLVASIMRDVADAVIMPRWRNLATHEVSQKSGAGDLVTIADREAETLLTTRLGALLPGSHVNGEEAVAADPGLLQLFRKTEPVWVIDPIDGTRKFTEGKTIFDVMVALVVGGRSVAGWIYAPAEDDFYMGEQGGGVVRQQARGALERIARPERAGLHTLTGVVSPGGFTNRGLPNPDDVRHMFRDYVRHTCAGHNYARLLKGDCDFLINFATLPWDHLPGLALTQELGFFPARLDQAPFDPLDQKGGILIAPDVASWRDIHSTLLPVAKI